MNQSSSLLSNPADREAIRHLLIGPPEVVQLTLHGPTREDCRF